MGLRLFSSSNSVRKNSFLNLGKYLVVFLVLCTFITFLFSFSYGSQNVEKPTSLLHSNDLITSNSNLMMEQIPSTPKDSLKIPRHLNKGQKVKIDFVSDKADGKREFGSYTNKRVDDATLEVQCHIEQPTDINPYEINYSYQIKSLANSYEVEMKSALNPMDLMVNENVQIKYDGDWIVFPKNLSRGATLKNARGRYDLYLRNKDANALPFISYEVKVDNRTLSKVSMPGVDGDVYLHTYKVTFQKNIDSQIIEESVQIVDEWFSPSVGTIKQDRQIDGQSQVKQPDASMDKRSINKKKASILKSIKQL